MKKSVFVSLMLIFAFISSLKCQDRYPIDEKTTSAEFDSSQGKIEKFSPNEWLTEKKAVLLFWTTWCPYCRNEIKNLKALTSAIKAKGIKLYLINVQEAPSRVQQYVEKVGIDSPVVLDTRGTLAVRYRILGFPTYIFLQNGTEIDRNNFISLKYLEALYD